MDILIDKLGFRKWIVYISDDKIIYLENDNWTWRIAKNIFACNYVLTTIEHKHDSSIVIPLNSVALDDDTVIDYTSFLLNCKNLNDFFDKKFSHYEKLEKYLTKYFIVKVPVPMRSLHYRLNQFQYGNSDNEYRIELFDLKNPNKEICVLIPLIDEIAIDGTSTQFPEKGKYMLYLFPPAKVINTNHGNPMYDSDELRNWSVNYRRCGIYCYNIPFDVMNYVDNQFSTSNKKLLSKSKEIALTLLCIQKFHYPHIDKNVFLMIISLLFNNNPVDIIFNDLLCKIDKLVECYQNFSYVDSDND